jgi:hypothetical protein
MCALISMLRAIATWHLTMKVGDAEMRRHRTKLIQPNHHPLAPGLPSTRLAIAQTDC